MVGVGGLGLWWCGCSSVVVEGVAGVGGCSSVAGSAAAGGVVVWWCWGCSVVVWWVVILGRGVVDLLRVVVSLLI